MKSSWLAVTVALGAVAGLLIIVHFKGSVSQLERPGGDAAKTASKQRDARLQQRLDELHAARARMEEGATTGAKQGHIEAPSGVPVTTDLKQKLPRAGGQQTGPAIVARPDAARATMQREPLPADDDPDDIASLERIYGEDPDPERRLAAVTLLGASDDPQVIPILARALSDPDEDVRLAAVQSLSDFTGEAAVDAIEPALNDSSADIRYEALEVLSDLDPERSRPFIEKALSDPDEEVRTLAESLQAFDEAPAQPPGRPGPQGHPTGAAPRS